MGASPSPTLPERRRVNLTSVAKQLNSFFECWKAIAVNVCAILASSLPDFEADSSEFLSWRVRHFLKLLELCLTKLSLLDGKGEIILRVVVLSEALLLNSYNFSISASLHLLSQGGIRC
jgi:hypothetical protein